MMKEMPDEGKAWVTFEYAPEEVALDAIRATLSRLGCTRILLDEKAHRVEDALDAQLRTPLTVVVDRLKLPAKRKRLVEALEQGMFLGHHHVDVRVEGHKLYQFLLNSTVHIQGVPM